MSAQSLQCPACGQPVNDGDVVCAACGVALTTRQAPYQPGHVLESRYRIDVEVGRGGMGVVYRGTDLTLSRAVAIKAVRQQDADAASLGRFIREARALAQVEHPGLVPVYAVGSQDGAYYLVMKFIEGRTLQSLLKEQPTLMPEAVQRLVVAVCDALSALHRNGLIHRDIKPGNIMVQPGGRVVVMDLGIVKSVDEQTHTTALALGTPKYMAPELLTGGRIDGRVDLYSLGVIAFECLAGHVPFDGPTPMAILFKHAHEAPAPIGKLAPEAPRRLAQAVDRALAKEPADRFDSVDEFAEVVAQATARQGLPPAVKWLIPLLLLAGLAGAAWHFELLQGLMPPDDAADAVVSADGTKVDAGLIAVAADAAPGPDQGPDPTLDAGPVDAAPAAPAPTETPDARPPAIKSQPSTVAITVLSVPPGAQVFDGSRKLGRTPVTVRQPRKPGGTATWTLRRKGYQPQQVRVKLSANQKIRVKLVALFELLP